MSTERASVAKITRPVLPGTYPRQRLFRILDQGRKFPATWVSGPPGCGKTATVSGYVEARRLHGIWYQVDVGDADPATFFYYLGLAGRKAAPRKRAPMPHLTPEFLPNLNAFTHRFFEDLYGRLAAGSVVIFDNCQNAPSASPFLALLREGLSRLPDGLTAILISRSHPPAGFARNRLNRQLGHIGWKELRLTEEETRGISRHKGKRRMPRDAIRDLHRRADGWAAGVTLLLEAEGMEGAGTQRPARQPPEEIFDYFAEEIYARLGKDIRGFLLRTAFLPRMTAAMAQRLTGNAHADRILSYLSRHNYFTEKHPAPEPVYQYHALFRDFILERARRAIPGKGGEKIRREAASILLEEGQAEDAAEHLRMVGDWSGLIRVILREAPSLIAQGRNRVLSDWIRDLPGEHFRASPWLSYWLGVAILPFEPSRSRRLFEEALPAFRREGDAAGAFLSWSGIAPAVWFGGAGFEYYDAFLPTLNDLLREFGGFPSPEIEARALCGMLKALSNWMPVNLDGGPYMARARSVADGLSDIALKGALLMNVVSYMIIGGSHTGQINSLLGSLGPLLREKDLPPAIPVEVALYAAHNFLSMAEYDQALEAAAAGLKAAESSGFHLLDMLLLGKAMLAASQKGDADGAKETFRRMTSLLPKAMPHDGGFYHSIAAWEALEGGDPVLAERHWKLQVEMGAKTGLPAVTHLGLIQGSLVHRALGKPREASAYLAEARTLESRHRCDAHAYISSFVESLLLTEEGDAAGGAARVREGMQRARELGQLGTSLCHRKLFAEVAALALREGIEVPFVQKMIRKNRLVPPQGELDLSEWPWPVQIHTLGRFALVVDGVPLPFSRKGWQKPLQLLKALIALGGREVPDEQLSEILWPEADGDLAHQSLSTTMKRLRKRIGDERAVLLRDGRVTLNNRLCWVDTWAFERILGQASASRNPGGPVPDGRKAVRDMEKAISLYRGEFLPDEAFCPGIITHRERLRSKFLRAVVQAGRHWERFEAWDVAIASYRKGLEVDPLSEELYRGLISCHVRMGRAAEAHAAYQRYRKMLLSVLGVSPSPALEALLKDVPADSGPRPR